MVQKRPLFPLHRCFPGVCLSSLSEMGGISVFKAAFLQLDVCGWVWRGTFLGLSLFMRRHFHVKGAVFEYRTIAV